MRYRHVCEADRARLEESIALDPEHRGQCTADYWLSEKDKDGNNVPGIQFFAVEDNEGTIGYIRAENVVRIRAQFCPQSGRERLAKGIDEFMKSFKRVSENSGYRQIVFNSTFAPLVRFLRKRGFHSDSNEQICDLLGD